jgi:hypothetical protein
MTARFTVSTNGQEVALSDGYDAELHDIAHGGHYSNCFAFGYCQDISTYGDVDDCKFPSDVPSGETQTLSSEIFIC